MVLESLYMNTSQTACWIPQNAFFVCLQQKIMPLGTLPFQQFGSILNYGIVMKVFIQVQSEESVLTTPAIRRWPWSILNRPVVEAFWVLVNFNQ